MGLLNGESIKGDRGQVFGGDSDNGLALISDYIVLIINNVVF